MSEDFGESGKRFWHNLWKIIFRSGQYAIPKIKMLCNLSCLKRSSGCCAISYQRHSSLNLVLRQLKLCNIFIFGMAYPVNKQWVTAKGTFNTLFSLSNNFSFTTFAHSFHTWLFILHLGCGCVEDVAPKSTKKYFSKDVFWIFGVRGQVSAVSTIPSPSKSVAQASPTALPTK